MPYSTLNFLKVWPRSTHRVQDTRSSGTSRSVSCRAQLIGHVFTTSFRVLVPKEMVSPMIPLLSSTCSAFLLSDGLLMQLSKFCHFFWLPLRPRLRFNNVRTRSVLLASLLTYSCQDCACHCVLPTRVCACSFRHPSCARSLSMSSERTKSRSL